MLHEMLALVTAKFNGRSDKGGQPYVLHCLKVMHYCKTDDFELQCICLGHDLVEDTDITYKFLHDFGFSTRIIEGIRAMTKVPGETPEEYLEKIKANPDAVKTKLADLRHNSDIRRMKGLTEKDFARLKKYQWMYAELMQVNTGTVWLP